MNKRGSAIHVYVVASRARGWRAHPITRVGRSPAGATCRHSRRLPQRLNLPPPPVARRRGDSPDDAVRTARLRAGSIPQALEALHDQRGLPWIEDLARDVRYGLLALKRHPAFTTIAVLTLALGVGANSAIFSVVNGVLLRPLPYHQPDRLVSAGSMLAGEYLFLRDHTETLQEIALYRADVGFNLSHSGDAERVTDAYVSANLFSSLGISAVVGRTFRAAEEQPGESGVVVLSHALWRQRFGEDSDIIGRDVLIDSEPRRVVGVMPSTFHFPAARTQLWIPYAFDPRDAAALWGGGPMRGQSVARLAPQMTPAQAQAELRARARAAEGKHVVGISRYVGDES